MEEDLHNFQMYWEKWYLRNEAIDFNILVDLGNKAMNANPIYVENCLMSFKMSKSNSK